MKTEPGTKVILYGSHARGDFHKNSDYDILILLDFLIKVKLVGKMKLT